MHYLGIRLGSLVGNMGFHSHMCLRFVFTEGNCRAKAVGWDYIGNTNKTLGGYTCQRWDSQIDQRHISMDISNFPDDTFADAANYCRNPDYDLWPWCFTTVPAWGWEFCPTYELSCGNYSYFKFLFSLLSWVYNIHDDKDCAVSSHVINGENICSVAEEKNMIYSFTE